MKKLTKTIIKQPVIQEKVIRYYYYPEYYKPRYQYKYKLPRCYKDSDCNIDCPQVVGQDTPRCCFLTGDCYCGSTSGPSTKCSLEPEAIPLVPPGPIPPDVPIDNSIKEMIKKFRKSTPDPHDAHVLAGAGLSGAKILLSLDKQHILIPRVRNTLKPMLVLSPKYFWGSRNQT